MPSSRDVELKIFPIKEDSFAHGSSYAMREPMYEDAAPQGPFDRWIEGFRRDPNSRITPKDPMDEILGAAAVGSIDRPPLLRNGNSHYYDMRMAALRTAQSGLARKLKGRHLQMIAIGGSIGTGLFVASGRALQLGGPASLLVAYSFVGAMLYFTVQALGELAVAFPVAGSFSAFSTRFLDPSWGFAMGWNYALQWVVVLPLEIIAASITISYWNPFLPRAIFVTIFLIAIVIINFFGVKGYGEAEFVFAIVKVTAVIGFILLGIVLNIGGTPNDGYIGGRFWQNPGAFHNGFKGLCSVFVMAAFAFAGTELVGLAAAETMNPRKSLPTAIKQVFWRITLFYIVALTLIGLLVPYNDSRLLSGEANASAAASPFVIAIENASIDILPSVMNVVILIAVLSVGNSSVFGSSRTLAALADQGQAPRILSYIDRRGRPLVAIIVASSVGLLAYLADLDTQSTVLDWLLAISGLSSVFTWASICLAHIRFRKAWASKGHSLRELAFRSQCGVWGSWLGFSFNMLVLVAQFWVGAWPVNFETMSGLELAENFFLQYMAAPIVVLFYIAHRLYYKTSIVHIRDMDIDTGRRDFNLPILLAQENEEKRVWPRWKKVYKFLC
ncbi:amino acid permease [Xylariales sp. AK1849]|nr:amino acid permease [Xylariales sp. AK1849]